MTVKLSPIGNDAPFVDANGDPLSGGKLYTYVAGSGGSTSATTYQDSGGSTPNQNPVVLDSNGYPSYNNSVVEIWLTSGVSYLFILKTSAGVTVWSRDNVSGINDLSGSMDEWVSGPAPTYISATSFSLVGDQTGTFQVGRRVKTTNSGGTVYSTITASTFGAVTTVVVANDSGTLDSGLSAVSYALLSSANDAMARNIFPTMLQMKAYLHGLTMSTAGGSGTMAIAAGSASDSTGADVMVLASAISKTTSAWAVGTGNGGLDTGAIANSTLYYFYLIKRVDTQVVDVLFSTSATAPTMPANYTLKRRIGAMKTDGSAHWLAFTQYNDKFLLTTPVQDANGTTGATTRIPVSTGSVPPSMIGLYRISLQDGTNLSSLIVQPIAETDAQASGVASPGLSLSTSVLGQFAAGEFEVPVNASSQIAVRSGSATAVYQVVVKGWIDYRGKDS